MKIISFVVLFLSLPIFALNINSNALINSQSPYLLQHANNPINWQPWSSELLAQAQKNNQLIFLSIGYSSCHWCQIMEKESFSQQDVAKVLNEHYIAIKVDREELPYIDEYYAAALEGVKGSAGWPINAIIMGDGKPVFIDSYLSKIKLLSLLTKINNSWQTQPDFLNSSAKNIDALVQNQFNLKNAQENKINRKDLSKINTKLVDALDKVNGGFLGEVKFPSSPMLLYILDQLKRAPNSDLEKAIKLQLDKMISGGLFDHVDGGFHRYSTDIQWTIPHFEKMLYNQAQLIVVYSQAYELFRNPIYKEVVNRTTNFMLTSFYKKDVGFYSAIDADFKGEEGGFYLWDAEELKNISATVYSVPNTSKKAVIFPWRLDERNKKLIVEKRKRLQSLRRTKGKPTIDKKILTGWNGLVIKALIAASKTLDEQRLFNTAAKIAESLWKSRFNDSTGQLKRTGYDLENEDSQTFLEDIAYFSDALIDLYDNEADTQKRKQWLNRADKLIKHTLQDFLSTEGSLYNVSSSHTNLALKKSQDGELVSPAAVILDVMIKLDKRLGTNRLKKDNQLIIQHMGSKVKSSALDHLSIALALNNYFDGSTSTKRYFALAKGELITACTAFTEDYCEQLELNIHLQKGWHINSVQPLQSYLKATKINPIKGISASYPDAIIVSLGFQKKPLSVYEGDLKIIIKRDKNSYLDSKQREYMILPLQACNDKVCLLPEAMQIVM